MVKKRYLTKLNIAILVIVAIMIVTMTLCTQKSASAETIVGNNSLKVVTDTDYQSGSEFRTKEQGFYVKVTCPDTTTSLYYIQDSDYYTTESFTPVQVDILLTEEDKNSERQVYQKSVKLTENGSYTFYALQGEENTEEVEYILNQIDDVAPKYNTSKYYAPEYCGNSIDYTIEVTDKNTTQNAACSGINTIKVYWFDDSKITEDSLAGLTNSTADEIIEFFNSTYGVISEWHADRVGYYVYSTQEVQFKVQKNGRYYVNMIDNCGNESNAYLGKYTEEPIYQVKRTDGITVNLDSTLEKAQQRLENEKDLVAEEIMDDLEKSYEDLIMAFRLNKTNDEILKVYSVFQTAMTEYTNAKTTYKTVVNNKELLGGTIEALNLDLVSDIKKGDKILLTIDIIEYSDLSKFSTFDYSKYNIEPKTLYVLKYSLTINEKPATLNKDLLLTITFDNQIGDVMLIVYDDENYVERSTSIDDRKVQFATAVSTENFYLMLGNTKEEDTLNLGLIIGCSVGGGSFVAIVAVIIVMVIRKKRKATKLVVEENTNTSEDLKKPSKKKHKNNKEKR